METWRHGDMKTWRDGDIKWKTEAWEFFLNPFTICSLCKRKFVVCPLFDEETNGSYLLTDEKDLSDLPIYDKDNRSNLIVH
jgi:hypothetical protein